jgi:transcriptional regulator with XRE-family HTH domain
MTLYQTGIKPSRRAAARFVTRVRRALQRALVEEGTRTGLSQSDVARSIDVHRSVISRELNGRQDITLGRVAELAWAMGREIQFDLVEEKRRDGENVPFAISGAVQTRSVPIGSYEMPTPVSRAGGNIGRDLRDRTPRLIEAVA